MKLGILGEGKELQGIGILDNKKPPQWAAKFEGLFLR